MPIRIPDAGLIRIWITRETDMSTKKEEWIDVATVAALLDRSYASAWRLVQRGVFTVRRYPGGRMEIPRSEVERLITISTTPGKLATASA